MMEQLETGNIGIGNTSTLATLNNDRFITVEQKEIFWKMRRRNAHAFRREDSAKAEPEGRTSVRGASLKVLGRTCFRFRRGNGGQAAFAKLAAGEIRHIKKSAFVMGVGTRA